MKIIMYHYVRPELSGPQERFKALSLQVFREHLDLLASCYNVIGLPEFLNKCHKGGQSCGDDILLSFDDGFSDHYRYVFQELAQRGLSGSFFPPVRPIVERKLLDVHKLHFILGGDIPSTELVSSILKFLKKSGFSDENLSDLQQEFAKPSALDDGDTIFIKRLLQYVLPENLREEIISELFLTTGLNEADLCEDFYLSLPQMREMYRAGMSFGCHGFAHCWLGKQDPAAQAKDIMLSLDYLRSNQLIESRWVMCYPYGSFNSTTIDICKTFGGVAGFTTFDGDFDPLRHSMFEVPRIDAVNFYKHIFPK